MNYQSTTTTVQFRRFAWTGLLLAAWAAIHVRVANVVCAEEPLKPLGYQRQGDLELIAWLPYKTPSDERRVLRVVLEEFTWDREPTIRERQAMDALEETAEVKRAYRPGQTFQHRSAWRVFWILDGEPESKLEECRPVGVVYAEHGHCGPIFKNFAGDLLWHPSRDQFLLVLSMSCTSELTVAIFPLDLDAKLDIKPFGIAGKFPAEYPRVESQWPKPLAPIAEMRTNLPHGICDVMAIRAVPERRFVKRVNPKIDESEGIDERNLLISAWNVQSNTCNSIMYRYKLVQREWRVMNLTEGQDEPVKSDSTPEYLRKKLEIPPEEIDPTRPRRPQPLEPIPDPELYEQDGFGKYRLKQPKPAPLKK